MSLKVIPASDGDDEHSYCHGCRDENTHVVIKHNTGCPTCGNMVVLCRKCWAQMLIDYEVLVSKKEL